MILTPEMKTWYGMIATVGTIGRYSKMPGTLGAIAGTVLWLLFGGISRFVSSFDLQRLGVKGWGWFTALGVLLTVAGILSFYDPISGALALSWVAGLVLILEGVASIAWGCFSGRFWRNTIL